MNNITNGILGIILGTVHSLILLIALVLTAFANVEWTIKCVIIVILLTLMALTIGFIIYSINKVLKNGKKNNSKQD